MNDKLTKKAIVISSYAYIRGHNNYGSIFQYYALQQYLKCWGVKSYLLRYMFPTKDMLNGLAHKAISELHQKWSIANTFRHIKTQWEFRSFLHNRCNVTPLKYTSIEELKRNPPQADIYITGSDQVFGGWLEPNFLTFAPKGKPRVAYAASFGKRELTSEHQAHIINWLQAFDAVSVRERSGVEICLKMGVKTRHLLDPTLLLDAEDYLPDNTPRAETSKYIFCYFIHEKKAANLRIDDISKFSSEKEVKLKVTGIEGPEQVVPRRYLCQYSPEKWLNHYRYADYVFTNTFHGTVFCIIFHKKFCVLLQKGTTIQQNERIYSLLEMFGLQDRILEQEKAISSIIDDYIDWTYVEEVKKNWREKTDLFWKEILNRA